MKMHSGLGPCLGMCLLFAGVAAVADEDTDAQAAAAQELRIHIDRKTGEKTVPDDSDLGQAGTRAQTPAEKAAAANREEAELAKVSARTGLPIDSQGPVRKADGSLSARVGLREMKYMVMTIDKDGKRLITHKSLEEAAETPAPDTGEE